MKNLSWILLLLMFTNCKTTSKNNIIQELATEDNQIIEYLFESYKADQPGINAMVIKEGKIVLNESYGIANINNKIKITPETNFRIASVTKQFTAMAIMILENQGKLKYETKLTDIFPDFPDYGKDITVRNLITNQSGLVDYFEFINEDRVEQYLDKEILDGLMKLDSTNFEPGSKYEYSNTGYAVLAQIVEKVSGQTFPDFMDKEIFQKLNMTSTQIFQLDNPIKNRAYGHSIKNDSIIFKDQSVSSAIQGDGGIYSNVMDYYKWDQALYSNKLLPKEKLEDAFYDWDNNKKTNKEGYGYGWFIDLHNETKVLNHGGGTAGFEHRVSRIPSLNLSVVLFSNRDGNGRNIMHRTNALTSIYSDYKIPMPIEIMMKKEIDQRGINYGIEIYDKLKDNPRYKNKKTTLSYLGFEYRRMQKLKEAESIFIKATEEHPNYFGGYWGLGIIYKNTDEIEKAILNFKKVIELGTEDEEWILDRAKEVLKDLLDKDKD